MRRRYAVVGITVLAVGLAGALAWPWLQIKYVLFMMREDRTVAEFQEHARRLAGCGPDIVPHLVYWLDEESSEEPWRNPIAIAALGLLGTEAVPHMCDLASRESTPMNVRRYFALLILDHYDDMEGARETLARLSRDPDPEIRGFVLKFMQAQRAGRFLPARRPVHARKRGRAGTDGGSKGSEPVQGPSPAPDGGGEDDGPEGEARKR